MNMVSTESSRYEELFLIMKNSGLWVSFRAWFLRSLLLLHEWLDDCAAMPVEYQVLGLSAWEHPGPFPELPVHDLFSVPIEGVKQRCFFPPDGGTVEFPVLTQNFSHEAAGTPQGSEVFWDFSVFRIIPVETHFPLFSPKLFLASPSRFGLSCSSIQGDEISHIISSCDEG